MKLVLDLSALQASSFSDFQQLCNEHEVWIPEALFFEVLTKKYPEDRAKCFAKVQSVSSRFKLISNVGNLCALEIARDGDVRPEHEAYKRINWINDARFRTKTTAFKPLNKHKLFPGKRK